MIKKILAFLLVFVVVFGFSASADSSYKSYVYDNNGVAFEAPDAFDFDEQIDLVNMKDEKGKAVNMYYPSDMCVDKNGMIYVSGTDYDEQGMLLILNPDFTFKKLIKNFENTVKVSETETKVIKKDVFGNLTSTFVDEKDGSIYVCDMTGATVDNTNYDVAKNVKEEGSGRLIKFDKNFNVQMIVAGVESEILPKGFNFRPYKTVVDDFGRIFVLSQGCTMGILEFDEAGDFIQTIGAPTVTYNPIELIWRAISSDSARENMQDFVPTEYSGIEIDDEGFIFVTNSTFNNSSYSGIDCVSRLNAKGNDVLRRIEGNNPYGDVEASWRATLEGPSRLVDIKTLDYGNYAVLDSLRGKVFFYNIDGVNLFEFGTVEDDPDDDHVTFIKGNLDVPVAVEWLNNECIVLDSELRCINVYAMTEYASLIIEASRLHEADLYDEEIAIWEEVLKLNNNSVAAKQNIGKVYYRDGEWKVAMEYFRDIKDQENYSKAYKYQRQQYINDYFTHAVVVIVILILAIWLFKKFRKKSDKEKKSNAYFDELKFANVMMFRPLNAPWLLTRENKGSVRAATTFLIAVSIMSLLQARFTGFIFDPNAENVNIIAEFAAICLPVLLFTVCNWAVTSLMNGEGSFKAIYMQTCYSLVPILYLYPVAILLSNVMVQEEGDFYTVFVTLALVWVLGLIFLGNMRIHDYTLGMAAIEILITVVVMLLVVFLAVLFFALIQQMGSFVTDIIDELATR